ncbi:NAD-dependent epimerase/dehydratase family protein [Rothia sp. P6271]|uniref:NAD-dependent epimerase/dehydratase family protein n=1 Tax=Rothia sp. P6271 TaxID=3402659 RepID=UPI003AC470F2
MAEASWKVIGASGFVGSSIIARLQADGIDSDPIEAPRLATSQTNPQALIKEAYRLEGIINSLADSFAGADVVINASGLAAPHQQELAPLIGANALLPAVIAIAAQRTGVKRILHMSSAAVQGSSPVLNNEIKTSPFSAYSFSKALGEKVLLMLLEESQQHARTPEICIIRATSVQGSGRKTTESFAKIASSFLGSVAGTGQQSSPVSSSYALAEFVSMVGQFPQRLPAIVVQPWEGSTCSSVLIDAGRRRPFTLPHQLCQGIIRSGYAFSRLLDDRFQGTVRRVEVMWFGQRIDDSWARNHGLLPEPRIQEVLRSAHLALGRKKDRKYRSSSTS